jgi:hypothetical protein
MPNNRIIDLIPLIRAIEINDMESLCQLLASGGYNRNCLYFAVRLVRLTANRPYNLTLSRMIEYLDINDSRERGVVARASDQDLPLEPPTILDNPGGMRLARCGIASTSSNKEDV